MLEAILETVGSAGGAKVQRLEIAAYMRVPGKSEPPHNASVASEVSSQTVSFAEELRLIAARIAGSSN